MDQGFSWKVNCIGCGAAWKAVGPFYRGCGSRPQPSAITYRRGEIGKRGTFRACTLGGSNPFDGTIGHSSNWLRRQVLTLQNGVQVSSAQPWSMNQATCW